MNSHSKYRGAKIMENIACPTLAGATTMPNAPYTPSYLRIAQSEER